MTIPNEMVRVAIILAALLTGFSAKSGPHAARSETGATPAIRVQYEAIVAGLMTNSPERSVFEAARAPWAIRKTIEDRDVWEESTVRYAYRAAFLHFLLRVWVNGSTGDASYGPEDFSKPSYLSARDEYFSFLISAVASEEDVIQRINEVESDALGDYQKLCHAWKATAKAKDQPKP